MAKKLQVFGNLASIIDEKIGEHLSSKENPHQVTAEQIGAATQEEVREFVYIRRFEKATSGSATHQYNFVTGNTYKITSNCPSYVNVTIKDENDAEVHKFKNILNTTTKTLTFTATGNAVKIQLYFGAAGSVDVENISCRIPVIEEEIENIQNFQKDIQVQSELTDFAWIIGGIDGASGKSTTNTKRIRTGFIPVTGYGGSVIFDGEGGFIVYEYASNNELSNLIARTGTGTDWCSDKYTIQKDECKYIRIVAKQLNDGQFIDESLVNELGSHFKLTQSFFTNRAAGRYVSPVKEEFFYDDELEVFSTENKLETLYAKWDALHEAYPSVVSEKTVLGEVGGKEIRSYKITPTPMKTKDITGITRYSCEPLKMLYVSCIHGGEGAIGLDDFTMFKNLVESHKPSVLWNNCVFEVIPVVNPVGYDEDSRYNGNKVNINRNFPVGWTYVDSAVDQYNASGDEPGSEYETQVLMNFVKSHPDAFLVLNRHGTKPWAQNDTAGYVSCTYQSDIETAIASGIATDTSLRKKYPEINEISPNNRIYFTDDGSQFAGTFDRWFDSVGYHGYLLEYTDRVADGVTEIDNGTVRRINIVGIANLLCDCVLNNREIIGNNNKLPS